MSFKNDKEYEEAKRKWQNSRMQFQQRAGYERFLAAEEAYKNKDNDSGNDEVKINNKKKGGGIREASRFNSTDYKKRDAQHTKNMQKLINKAKKDYKPKELKVDKRKPLTSKNLPDRPNAPKMPGIKLPGGVLTSDKVAKPSGLPGKIKDYSVSRRSNKQLKSNYSNAPIK